ncbi:MAG: hypothetical protein HY308_08690 [Gammaproteobacteria bacterium]|nr:hypothetical protein [Gammaproteobacteria bacterium]
MKTTQKIGLFVGLACLACCAGVVIAAIGTLGAAGAFVPSPYISEFLECVLPVGLLALGYLGYRVYQHKRRCCVKRGSGCNTNSCGTTPPPPKS